VQAGIDVMHLTYTQRYMVKISPTVLVDWEFSWFSLAPPEKCQDSAIRQTTACQFTIQKHCISFNATQPETMKPTNDKWLLTIPEDIIRILAFSSPWWVRVHPVGTGGSLPSCLYSLYCCWEGFKDITELTWCSHAPIHLESLMCQEQHSGSVDPFDVPDGQYGWRCE